MRILFDFITTQPSIGGAAEYVRSVYYKLLNEIRSFAHDVEIVGIIDSSIGHYAYEDLTPDKLKRNCAKVVDINEMSLAKIIQELRIDRVFIGMAQQWGHYELATITCPVVVVIHDICQEEFEQNNIVKYLMLSNPQMLFKHLLKEKIQGNIALSMMAPYERLFERENFNIVAVSNYTKYSLMHQYSLSEDRIRVLYSPERQMEDSIFVKNETLRELITIGETYYLMLNANRAVKNVEKTLRAFKEFQLIEPNSKIVTVGYKGNSQYPGHIVLPFLSETDLVNAMKKSYALVFPSLFEGFGYPPVEAMKFSKPVLVSNVTSMPGILGDAPIYFSPFYESDIYAAFCRLKESDYNTIAVMSRHQYDSINARQKRDLSTLIKMICTDEETA